MRIRFVSQLGSLRQVRSKLPLAPEPRRCAAKAANTCSGAADRSRSRFSQMEARQAHRGNPSCVGTLFGSCPVTVEFGPKEESIFTLPCRHHTSTRNTKLVSDGVQRNGGFFARTKLPEWKNLSRRLATQCPELKWKPSTNYLKANAAAESCDPCTCVRSALSTCALLSRVRRFLVGDDVFARSFRISAMTSISLSCMQHRIAFVKVLPIVVFGGVLVTLAPLSEECPCPLPHKRSRQ